MNFQLVILLAVAVAAFAIPLPDEHVTILEREPHEPLPKTEIDELITSAPNLVTIEDGTSAVVGNVTVENVPKVEMESEHEKPTEGKLQTTSVEDKNLELPKSLPSVMAGIVPPVSEVRAEPKEGVEIGEAKSTASSPDADEVENKFEPKPTAEVQATNEGISGSLGKTDGAPSTEEKSKTETTENKSVVAGENKIEDSATTETKKSDKKGPKKEKHDHSSEEKKSEESAESKESEESNESKKN